MEQSFFYLTVWVIDICVEILIRHSYDSEILQINAKLLSVSQQKNPEPPLMSISAIDRRKERFHFEPTIQLRYRRHLKEAIPVIVL